MKKLLTLLLLSFLLFSCGEEEKNEDISEKQDFFVETQKLSSFSGSYEIKKTGKIKASQDIILYSKASGRVGNISVNFGDKVHVGKSLINLSDNIANYGLNLEKTNLSLESSRLNYESTKLSLDKTVSDLEINLEKLEIDYDILKKTLEQNLKQAKNNLNNSTFSSEVNISKAETDYNKLLKSNIEQIKSFEELAKNDYLSLKNLFTDIIDFSDGILGVTDLNKDRNDSFEDYLGIKNSTFTLETEHKLLDLINFKKENFDNLESTDFEINNLEKLFLVGDEGYEKAVLFLDNLEKVLDYSIENVYFNRIQIDLLKSQINNYQTNLSSKYNAFLNFKSNTDKFLNTYKDNEISLKKSLEIAEENAQINYEKTILNSSSSLNSLEISLKNAKLNLENAIKSREITLKQLNNYIALGQNTSSLAYKEYSKLYITSPISGVVSEVLVDDGQDVSNGTPLIKLTSLGKNEIEIGLSFSEINFIKIGDEVKINYLGNKLTGNISAISKVADSNLNYKTKISINSKINISGNIVEVLIPIKLEKNLIPLKNLKVKSGGIGEINILEDSKLNKTLVNFGEFYGEYVEIIGCIDKEEDCDNLEIITNDISNFDEEKFSIIKK